MPPGTPAGSSFPIENHRSAGAADADYPRDADCVAGPYIPRRKDRGEVPYLPQIIIIIITIITVITIIRFGRKYAGSRQEG